MTYLTTLVVAGCMRCMIEPGTADPTGLRGRRHVPAHLGRVGQGLPR